MPVVRSNVVIMLTKTCNFPYVQDLLCISLFPSPCCTTKRKIGETKEKLRVIFSNCTLPVTQTRKSEKLLNKLCSNPYTIIYLNMFV